MKFADDPSILDKIALMEQRVRWKDIAFLTRRINQTQLNIDDYRQNDSEFSFLVVGDTGFAGAKTSSPQRQIAQLMQQHQPEINFILHTGDVVYEVGSKEYYPSNFLIPYRNLIIGKTAGEQIPYDQITFKIPFLPVPGNHDYYNLPISSAAIAQIIKSFNWLTHSDRDLNIDLQGSNTGEAYARAFLDYTADLTDEELTQHLNSHYNGKFDDQFCLNYQPHLFTRLPNRYYSFRYSNIDFIALDSNTFNAPIPLEDQLDSQKVREELIAQLEILDQEYNQLEAHSLKLDLGNPLHQNLLSQYQCRIYQIQTKRQAIEQKLQPEEISIDYEQLNWFKNKLISSWSDSTVRGRIVYLHHSPYTTEVINHGLEETLYVRHHLRQILNEVANTIGKYTQGRPLIDLVISGHAHCFEHLYTKNTGFADSHINWLISGSGGHSVRRQKSGTTVISETLNHQTKEIAQSRLFLGCKGYGLYKKQLYSCLRIDVQASNPPKFRVHPLVAEQAYQSWYHYQLNSFILD